MGILFVPTVALITSDGAKTRDLSWGRSDFPSRAMPRTTSTSSARRLAAASTSELRARGHELHATRKEPWGQTVCRVLTSEGAIVGISYAPSLHEDGG